MRESEIEWLEAFPDAAANNWQQEEGNRMEM
jgi:hypothetical protein